MTDQTAEDGTPDLIPAEPTEDGDFGSLTIEDDPDGTIDPAELAGTADESDQDVS